MDTYFLALIPPSNPPEPASNIGNPAAIDRELFPWAQENGFIVFTHDLDLGAIHAATKADAPSVIQVRTQDTMPQKLSQKITHVVREYTDELANLT